MNLRKKAASLLVAGALLTAMPMGAFAKGSNTVEYVALGDSLAAGQTPFKTFDFSYPDYLVNHFKTYKRAVADYDNFGVSGYTTYHLLNDVMFNTTVQKELREATHITIDIGANDVLGALRYDPQNVPTALMNASNNIGLILKSIDQMNPSAEVYIMGYYNAFPHYPQSEQAKLLPVLDALNQNIKAQAKANGDIYVQVDDIIAKEYLENPLDIHLNLNGYQAIAKEFWQAITYKQRYR
ncbi:SGNH/GDSL hydrolase family protein [Fictibacillus sp. BK138]|uniref:SGNH/GDSL hydrolase family protein n=1 Tax=Fictibacillus sp. BK138 TaxID=2512121 RepID=UPI0010295496|nr:SGNH/GDSL hydrolase family protein [Fictibacillus sp. BK138]